MVPSLSGSLICGGLAGAAIVGAASSSSACASSPASLSSDLQMFPMMALRLSENWAACSAFPYLKMSLFISMFLRCMPSLIRWVWWVLHDLLDLLGHIYPVTLNLAWISIPWHQLL
jgi:hypothetical protein